MELLQEVANIAGKAGLYRIIKPGRVGVIVESIDDQHKREMVSANAKVSVLKEISVYTEDVNKALPLSDIFLVLKEKHSEGVDFDFKSASNNELFDFFATIMPDFDRNRVYNSDIKKIISWYNILAKYLPEAFEQETEKQ